jgi:Flp pilus assembly protein TadB
VSARLAELVAFAAVAGLCWPEPAVRPVGTHRAPAQEAAGGGRSSQTSPVANRARTAARTAADRRSAWPARAPVGLWIAATAGAGLLWLPLALLLGVGGPVAHRHRSRAELRRRERDLADALPEALDACTVVLGAGGTIRDSVEMLAGRGPAPLRPLAAEAVRRADAGQTFDQALRWLQRELGPGYQPLTGALLLAHEQGGSVGLLLARLSAEASATRRRRGELRARRLPVALLVPLVCCSLPAVLVGAVVPLAIVALRHLDL